MVDNLFPIPRITDGGDDDGAIDWLGLGKAHIRVDGDDEDDIVKLYLAAGYNMVEEMLGRKIAYGQRLWRDSYDSYTKSLGIQYGENNIIRLPDTASEIVFVRFLESDAPHTLIEDVSAKTYLDNDRQNNSRIYWKDYFTISTQSPPIVVEVAYNSGWTDDDLPAHVVQAVISLACALYENRSGEAPMKLEKTQAAAENVLNYLMRK